MDLQLKNKIALVTGASRGLGYATAAMRAIFLPPRTRLPMRLRRRSSVWPGMWVILKCRNASSVRLPGRWVGSTS